VTRSKLDLNDAVVSPFFVIFAAVDVEVLGMDMFGFDFADTIINIGAGISTATIISALALVVAFATNRPDFSKMGAIQTWVAIATIALVITPPFFPILDSLLSYNIAGMVAIVIQATGFYTLAYLG